VGEKKMQTTQLITAQLSNIMDSNRFHRAMDIPPDYVHLIYFSPGRLQILATIEGSQGDFYWIDIDENSGIKHDCPDFQKRGCFCKHLGRLTSLFPIETQDKIIKIYQDLVHSTHIDETRFKQNFHILHNFDHTISLTSFMFPLNSESHLLRDYLSELILSQIQHNAQDFFYYINNHQNLFHLILPLIPIISKPIPPAFENLTRDNHISDELRAFVTEIIAKSDELYSVRCKSKYQILL
jgi:hypothetical protein